MQRMAMLAELMRTANQIKNFTAGIVRYLLTSVVAFYTRRLFIDALGVEYLGVAGLMGNVLGMLAIAELGIGSSIVFSLYAPLARQDRNKVHLLIDLYRRLYIYIATFVCFLGLALMPFLTDISPDLANIPHYRWIYLLFLANSVIPYFFAYNSTLYTASQQDYKLQNIRTLFYILTTGATILILTYWPNYILLTACTSALGIASQLLIYILAHRKWPWLHNKPEGKLPQEDIDIIKKNVRAMVLHKIGDYSINGTSNLIIANAVNLVTVGLLANYTVIVGMLKSILQQFFDAMIAGMGELIAVSPKEKVQLVFREMNFLAFWFYGLAMLGCYFCIDPVIRLWLGEGFELPRAAVFFMCFDLYIIGMRIPPNIVKSGAGMFSNDQYAPLFQALINLGIGITLAHFWGVTGVTFSIMLSGLLVPCWFRPYVIYRDYFKISFIPYLLEYALYLCILALIFLLLAGVFTLYCPSAPYMNAGYRILCVMVVFHVVLFPISFCLPQGRMAFSRLFRLLYPLFHKICPNH